MRLFKKGSVRTPLSSSSGKRIQKKEDSVTEGKSGDERTVSLANLFSDRGNHKLEESHGAPGNHLQSRPSASSNSPRPKRILSRANFHTSKPNVSENDQGQAHSSPKKKNHDRNMPHRVVFASPVPLTDSEDSFANLSMQENNPDVITRIDSISDEPKANRNSPRFKEQSTFYTAEEKSNEVMNRDDDFDVTDTDDELFMVEEATRRDFKRGEDVAADLETATVLFKKKNCKNNEDVDMSAEEILRTQRWGRGRNNLTGTPDRKRPPPLVGRLALPENSPVSTALSNVFGRDGGFVADGFKITSEGMVNKPDIDLREDEVKTMRGANHFMEIVMKSLKEFRKGPTIGAGAAGRVYLALHEPSLLAVAMKTVNVFDKALRSQLMKELMTLSRHVSRYLVRFYGAFYDGSGAVHIALEFMDRGCLASFVKKNGPIPEHIVQVIAMDCMRGLRFLHKYHVLHRDFKTANILLSREQSCAKISDFGLARDLNPGISKVNTFVGTVAYMSPERLQGSEYTYASDIWALGVSLCECLMGKYPFSTPQNFFDYIDATMTKDLFDVGNEEMVNLSESAKSFILMCTDSDPKKRPTAEELLNHPWLKNFTPDRAMLGAWMDDVSTKETPKNL